MSKDPKLFEMFHKSDIDRLVPASSLPMLEKLKQEKEADRERVQLEIPPPADPCATCDSLAEGGCYDPCKDCPYRKEE